MVAEGGLQTFTWTDTDVVPQPFVAVRVMVSVPSNSAALYVTEMVPLLVPLAGEKMFPSEDESDQLVAFATVNVMVAVSPRAIVPGDTLRPVIVGSGLTGMLFVSVAEQPEPPVTVTESWTGPVAATSQVSVRVPCPAVIVPFVIVHA